MGGCQNCGPYLEAEDVHARIPTQTVGQHRLTSLKSRFFAFFFGLLRDRGNIAKTLSRRPCPPPYACALDPKACRHEILKYGSMNKYRHDSLRTARRLP